MGYTHGKRRNTSLTRPRYIEDRLAYLETAVERLIKLAGGALEREEQQIQFELAELGRKKKAYLDEKKTKVLKRVLKKPVKRMRKTRAR